MLFRTEEIIDSSPASVESVRRLRRGSLQLGSLDRKRQLIEAVWAGVFDFDLLVRVIAADQQHEVHRSRYVEHLSLGTHRMEQKANTSHQPLMAW